MQAREAVCMRMLTPPRHLALQSTIHSQSLPWDQILGGCTAKGFLFGMWTCTSALHGSFPVML